jgi:hypothetical protein
MGPLFRKRSRGETYARVPDAFYCPDHDLVARGRKDPQYL